MDPAFIPDSAVKSVGIKRILIFLRAENCSNVGGECIAWEILVENKSSHRKV
jgi:hypothetical protein